MDIKYGKVRPLICQNCGCAFSHWATVDGKRMHISGRSYCLTCSPPGKRDRKQLKRFRIVDGIECRLCLNCKQFLKPEAFYRREDGSLRNCIACQASKHKTAHVSLKQQAIDYKGGRCVDCQQSFHQSVFEFHHLDRGAKDFNIMKTVTKQLTDIRQELDKCVLLCANCHRLRHHDNTNPNYLPHKAKS